jgi:hypothetical protein
MKIVSRITYIFCFLLFGGIVVDAQIKHANEWINPSKQYLKLKVAENGIYKVTYEDLETAGFLANKIDGAALKLFNFGTEQALHVSNNDFGPGSHFEFYGKKNTIGLDSLLYDDWQKDLFNPEYSLVNDTNAYFLTLAPETSNKRFTLVQPNYNNITITPFPYYLHEEKIVHGSTFFKNVDGDIRFSNFEPSEGFGTAPIQTSTTSFPVSQLYSNASKPVLEFRTGANGLLSRIEISWNNQPKETKIINPKLTSSFSYDLENTELLSNNTLNIKNTYSVNDRHRLAYAKLTYARSFDFNNKEDFHFLMPASATALRLLEISNFKSNNQVVFLYDIEKNIRYSTQINNAVVKVQINPSATQSRFLLISENASKKVPQISEFKPKAFANNGQEYVIISNKTLYNSGPDYVTEYAEYRSSPIGGGYKTEIVEIQDIYDHFGYGIDRHFVGVKQFSAYMKDIWDATKFVFIIGKGVEYPSMRTTNDIVNNDNRIFFVPTFGYTASDNMLFSERNYPDPYFAVGRLAARTQEDIKNYLNKIKQYDQSPLSPSTIEDQYWMKRVLHLGGGKDVGEQTNIQNGLNNMASILRDTILGADVYSFFKKNSEIIEFNINEEITNLFDQGVNVVNFFGHSGVGTWDFPLENPRNFKNLGKYPFINSFGCYSGNLHGISKGISESFVLEQDKGAIAFFASTGTAYIHELSVYGYKMYSTMLNENRHKTIGETIKKLAFEDRNAESSKYALLTQLTFHGDPAIKLHLDDAPDYIFDEKSVKTNPSAVQASIQNYTLEIEVANIGAHLLDTFDITFYHHQPDEKTIDTIVVRSEGIANKKSISVPLKNYEGISVGKNKILAKIDIANVILEQPTPAAEANNELVINNQLGFEYFVTANNAVAIYPPDFAMINTKDHFVLKASTSVVPVIKGNFVFQIDTTAYFNSPIKETGTVTSEGGLISYPPKMALVNNRVYYWRVSPDSLSPIENFKWSQASFAYLPDEEEGWNQSHFFQFQKNDFNDLIINEKTNRKFEFLFEKYGVQIKNKIYDADDSPYYIRNNINFGSVRRAFNYTGAGFIFLIIDHVKGEILNDPSGSFGSIPPGGSDPSAAYAFSAKTPNDRKKIMDFIDAIYKENTSIIVLSAIANSSEDLSIPSWESDKSLFGTNLFETFEKIGASEFNRFKNVGTVPYIFIGKKNHLGTSEIIEEKIAFSIDEILVANVAVDALLKKQGENNSVTIGPAQKWNDLKFKINEKSINDNSLIDLKALNDQGNSVILKENIVQNISLKDIDPIKYKTIYLKNTLIDSIDASASQMEYWRISLINLPDIAISYIKSEPNIANEEINQGENIKLYYEVSNVNYTEMDSILVKYTMTTGNNQSTTTFKKLKPLKAGEKLNDIAEFNVGNGNFSEIRFSVEVNPNQTPEELHTFNNVISLQYNVAKDKENPLLDVYFDGIKIMDGDIVSPKPEILVTLEDKNNFLPITDPELFEIKLDTGRNQYLEIPMSSPQIKFTPADQNNTTAKVHFYPTLRDGDYKLIVQGKDASGNKSGINPRSIAFKVIEKQSISNVLNYPNPFSTSTQFVFTLTGEEVPDIMSISIMTITGKVVKEITKEELGPLRIGINRTEYKWDGTDDFGIKLANGVYLYKVNSRKQNGEKYDQYNVNKIDNLFKDGFGKMVILR